MTSSDYRVQVILLLAPAIALALSATALALNAYQAWRGNRLSRATLITHYLHDFTSDADIQEVFYAIEYDRFNYTDEFHGSETERKLDKLLRHFASLALLWQSGLLTMRDLEPLSYYVLRIHRNDEVRRYLKYVEDWCQETGIRRHPYQAFLRMASEFKG